ncbi:MAG: Ig-like domain-containing protein, partial [Deinococcales bacterium]
MPKMGSRLWIYVLAAALGLAAILAGCSEPATPSVPDVTISPTSVTLGIGGTQKLTANVAVTWSSSDTAIATVAADGTVTGVAVGTATVTATSTVDTSKSASVTVTVSGEDVVISPGDISLMVGDTQKLTANVAVTWSSSDTAIATVAADGTVTGEAVGKTTITATSTVDTSKADTVEVTVTPVTPPPVIANLTATIAMESTVDLAWTASDATDFDVYAVLNS